MATLAVQSIARVGAAPTFAACTGGGDAAPVGTNTFIEVKNTGGTVCVVTIATVAAGAPFPGTALAAETFTVPITTGDFMYGPLNPQLFADPVTGMATITYSQVASCTIGCFNLSQP
jgi:hypothetical protein